MGKPVRCVKRLMEIVVIWIAYPHWAIWPWRSDIMVNEVVLRMMYHNCINWDSDKLKTQLGMKPDELLPKLPWADYPSDDKDKYPAAAAA